MFELADAADGCGADDGVWGEGGVGVGGVDYRAFREDEGVAGIFAFEGAGEGDAVGEGGFEVFEAVDGEIDFFGGEGFVDFLREEAFAADFGERAVLHGVAGGGDDVFVEDVHAAQDGAEFSEDFEEMGGLDSG